MLLIPYEVRTLYQRNPWGNLAVIAVTTVIFFFELTDSIPEDLFVAMILQQESWLGLLGYQFLHAGWWHLIGNMLFLFVFGNAVCGVMNTFLYIGVYLALGVAAGGAHLAFDGGPAIGASGAMCGVMGLYLAIYPLNQINCFWFFLIRFGTFGLAGWILILLWFFADLFGAFSGNGGVAYWAHIGGTVAGFAAGLLLLRFNLIDLFDYDHPTVLGLMRGERAPQAGF